MAINVYCGLQGSGKSFEVVSVPVLDAIASGRRVVTNIAGISQDRIYDYLEHTRGLSPAGFGTVEYVDKARVDRPGFFPDEDKPNADSVVRGGDLVVIDEAWYHWGVDGGRLSDEHMQFFRLHRHYVHATTKVTCDVCLMTQDVMSLHRSLRAVIETSFRMSKLKSVGLHNRYRVDVFEGSRLTKAFKSASYQKAYDPEIFPLYSSYTGGKGTERVIDSRQNMLKRPSVVVFVVLVPLVFIAGLGVLWRWWHAHGAAKSSPVAVAAPAVNTVGRAVGQAALGIASGASGPAADWSDAWRLVGEFSRDGMRWVVVADRAGHFRLESPSRFNGVGLAQIGSIDGKKVTVWSGGTTTGGVK